MICLWLPVPVCLFDGFSQLDEVVNLPVGLPRYGVRIPRFYVAHGSEHAFRSFHSFHS